MEEHYLSGMQLAREHYREGILSEKIKMIRNIGKH